jgi:hypothetical protein
MTAAAKNPGVHGNRISPRFDRHEQIPDCGGKNDIVLISGFPNPKRQEWS